jgi:hypothetical protein
MIKFLTAVSAAAAFIALPVTAAPVKMTSVELDDIVAGTYYPPPEETVKGNNGWGNGIDGTNPGSDKGNALQRSTKLNQTNPRSDKFTGR